MHSAKSSISVKRTESRGRSKSKSPHRKESTKSEKKSASGSTVSKSKKSAASAKSVTSLRSSLLSAKKSDTDDNKPKKVIINSPELAALNLRIEDMAFTGLTQIPPDIFTGKNIGVLDVSGNNLRSIPADIHKLTELRALNVSQNSIKSTSASDYSGLPKELARLRHLEIVAISECNLRYMPAVLFECITIKKLDISRNKFQMLPPDIGNLVDLEQLNASETSIKSLPPEIAFCERLREINLYGNILDMLPETMRELRELTELKLNARSFHSNIDDYMNKLLRNGQIKSEHIPSVLFDIPELRTLDLDGTRINNLPEENSCKLEELYLSNNYFLIVPKGLKQLPYLTMIDLSHNFLPSLPENIHEYMPSIRALRLNHNLLTSLPANICQLITLEELELCNNKLTQLPMNIGNLTQLRVLRAANNRISVVPESVCKLLDLETLEFTNNRISELPLSLFKLTKIKHMHKFSHMKTIGLWLHKNPITEPPEVIWKGIHIKPLHLYLKKLQIRRTANMQTVKLVVLGEQAAGKTTLTRTLASGKCQTRSNEAEISKDYLSPTERANLMKRLPRDSMIENMEEPISTAIANVHQWQSENAIKFCSFDMGGADIYKIIHQYFLEKCALFLIVFNYSKFDGQPGTYYKQIGYWIDLLQLHVPGAVVKLVGTHLDESDPEDEEKKDRVKECVHRQIAEHRANLATELMSLKEKIAEAEQLAAKGETKNTSNMIEFDPQMNKMQLEYQRRQIEGLMAAPLKLQQEITTVSCMEGLEGMSELMSDIELIAINKELMPSSQRYIPSSWKKMRNAIKKRPGFQLTWAQVKEIGGRCKLYGDSLTDCLAYIFNCGDIIWLETHPRLKEYVFHRPQKLVEVLRGVINHDIRNVLNYDSNKSFSSVSKLSAEQFEECRSRLLQYGEISRQLLLGLWYYTPEGRDEFTNNCQLISNFELGYLIPQLDVPSADSYREPLMVKLSGSSETQVIPWYVKAESDSEETDIYWSRVLEAGMKEMELIYNFTQNFPEGVFERLSAQLQGQAELRLDWANSIYIETDEVKILVRRYIKNKTQEIMVSIQVRAEDLRVAMKCMSQLHQTWITILTSIPGLVWRVDNYTARKHSTIEKTTSETPASTDSRPISTI